MTTVVPGAGSPTDGLAGDGLGDPARGPHVQPDAFRGRNEVLRRVHRGQRAETERGRTHRRGQRRQDQESGPGGRPREGRLHGRLEGALRLAVAGADQALHPSGLALSGDPARWRGAPVTALGDPHLADDAVVRSGAGAAGPQPAGEQDRRAAARQGVRHAVGDAERLLGQRPRDARRAAEDLPRGVLAGRLADSVCSATRAASPRCSPTAAATWPRSCPTARCSCRSSTRGRRTSARCSPARSASPSRSPAPSRRTAPR